MGRAASEQAAGTSTARVKMARAALKFAVVSALFPVILFGTAGRLDWPMGWVYVAVVLLVTLASRLALSRVSPDLLQERATAMDRADVQTFDRVLLPVIIAVAPPAMWILGGLGQRLGWARHDPGWVKALAAALLVAGAAFASWAMVENRFFSAVVRIQRDRGHQVVTTGPYAWVRHPGYAGSVVINLVTPILLESTWAFVPALVAVVAIVIRTALEDRFLHAELPGYAGYAHHTRWRLLPGVW